MDKIICVGKNYLEHAKELGDAVPISPVLFLKPPSTLVQLKAGENAPQPLDGRHGVVNFELELVLRIRDPKARNMSSAFDGFTLGLDLTKRKLQSDLKKDGHPWEIAKVFPHSAIVGPWRPCPADEVLLNTAFSLEINGKEVQRALAKDMRSSPLDCLNAAVSHFPVQVGDLIFTGTPSGVGGIVAGDKAELFWGEESLYRLSWIAL